MTPTKDIQTNATDKTYELVRPRELDNNEPLKIGDTVGFVLKQHTESGNETKSYNVGLLGTIHSDGKGGLKWVIDKGVTLRELDSNGNGRNPLRKQDGERLVEWPNDKKTIEFPITQEKFRINPMIVSISDAQNKILDDIANRMAPEVIKQHNAVVDSHAKNIKNAQTPEELSKQVSKYLEWTGMEKNLAGKAGNLTAQRYQNPDFKDKLPVVAARQLAEEFDSLSLQQGSGRITTEELSGFFKNIHADIAQSPAAVRSESFIAASNTARTRELADLANTSKLTIKQDTSADFPSDYLGKDYSPTKPIQGSLRGVEIDYHGLINNKEVGMHLQAYHDATNNKLVFVSQSNDGSSIAYNDGKRNYVNDYYRDKSIFETFAVDTGGKALDSDDFKKTLRDALEKDHIDKLALPRLRTEPLTNQVAPGATPSKGSAQEQSR